MPDYQVTVTATLERPVTEAEIDALADLVSNDTAMSVGDDLSITTSATAEGPAEAVSLAMFMLRSLAERVGVVVGHFVEVEALEWARSEVRT